MQSILVDSVVLNTIQAVHADVTLSKGNLTFKGLGTVIPLRKVIKSNAYRKTIAAAGTAQTSTFTVVAPDNSTNYTLTITKYPAVQNGLQVANVLYSGIEQYTVITDATATAAELNALFEAAITVAVNAGRSAFAVPTPSGTGVLTLVGATPNFSFLIAMSPNTNSAGATIGTQATTVPLVKTAGTYAQVYAINTNATSGDTYDEFSYRWYEDLGDDVLKQGQDQQECFEVKVFAKIGAANLAALITELDAQAAGTSAGDYLGF